MFKRILAMGIFWLGLSLAWAQDMPPLPSLPGDQNAAPAGNSTAAPLPALPGQSTAPSADNSAPLPALPGQTASPSTDNASPLPALPGQAQAPAADNSAPLPALPGQTTSPSSDNAAPLPALPGQPAGSSTDNGAPLPALPEQAAAPAADNSNATPLPALPGQNAVSSADNAAPLPALPSSGGTPTATGSSAAMPPLPTLGGISSDNTNTGALPALPGNGVSAQASPTTASTVETAPSKGSSSTEGEAVSKAKETIEKKWHPPVPQPNVIFGGWVLAKGGNDGSRIAWASQEILNILEFKGYKVVKEEGLYEGQKGRQWRQFSFKSPKSHALLQVYVRTAGKKVWMRVGPSEPPAGETMAFVKKLKAEDLKALGLLRKHFKKHLLPHKYVPLWEASYRWHQETADE